MRLQVWACFIKFMTSLCFCVALLFQRTANCLHSEFLFMTRAHVHTLQHANAHQTTSSTPLFIT
jgi:hypothetical protein